jgi:hypothetical protein
MKDLVARLGGRACHLNERVVAKYLEAETVVRLGITDRGRPGAKR